MRKLLFFFMFFLSLSALAQQRISGSVVDTNGEPLPGVNVSVVGATGGTVTDVSGEFSLEVSGTNVELQCSFIGMKSIIVPISKAQTSVSITMEEDFVTLDELVVVGYGTQKKGSVTGSISAINNDDLVKVSVPDVNNSLAGRLPGVRVQQLSSEPGVFDSNIDIRGLGQPLYVIDGISRDPATFARLNPNEIDNISILKDAAAAIYGVQAANGVVLVTTKKGTEKDFEVDYSFRMGINRVTQFPRLADAYQYSTMFNELHYNDFYSSGEYKGEPRFTPEEIEMYRTGELPSTDFMRLIMKDQSTQTQHNIGFSGGNEKVQYYTSFGFFGENGLWKTNSLSSNKYNFRTNVNAKLTKDLTFGVNLGYIQTTQDGQSESTWKVFRNTWRIAPTNQAYANGNPAYLQHPYEGGNNPLAYVDPEISGFRDRKESFYQSTFNLDYAVPFVKGLNLKAVAGYDTKDGLDRRFKKAYSQYDYDADNDQYNEVAKLNDPSDLSEGRWKELNTTLQLMANYNKEINGHTIGVLAVAEQRLKKLRTNNGYVQFGVDAIPELGAGIMETSTVGSHVEEVARQSLIGRVTYDYKMKYLLEASFRYDGSSLYPEDGRWGLFPSVSMGYNIAEESFIKDNVNFITKLKLRGSWGRMGDDGGARLVDHEIGYVYPDGGYYFGNGFKPALGIRNSVNPNFTWYTSDTYNAGIEASFWQGKVDVEFDVFERQRDGLPAYRNATLPGYVGVNLPQENLNGDITSGYEIVLGHRNSLNKDFSYFVRGNLSYTRTKHAYVEENPASNQNGEWRNTRSYRYNDIIWGYKTDGQFQNYDEIYNHAIMDGAGNRTILPGDFKYVDMNGDGVIDGNDVTPIANAGGKPLLYFGLNLGVSYKNFDFSVLLQGAAKYRVKYDDQLGRPFFWGFATPITEFWDRWHLNDMTDPESGWNPGRYPAMGERQNYRNSDFWWRDASYLRIKNVEIGYTVPEKLLTKIHTKGLRFYFTAFNLHTFTRGLDFVDPEYTSRAYSYNYPITMNMNFGVDIKL
ncbi:TonB-dependent receptor [Persicobacter diffluens]|uniref:SusC/RagA family TonB-linked outer membrane protein n=1 Tax=Persicobacter diffluens TaxID=981 RepID=A0AAN4W254_9BACT|nr:SusC/RagA family TonB-linked outer membrane protein [Persicobacter diffluens]